MSMLNLNHLKKCAESAKEYSARLAKNIRNEMNAVSVQAGNAGEDGFINFARIVAKVSSYANHPIVFDISGRGRQGNMKVTVVFHNNNSGKPGVNIFTQEGDCSYPVYMAVDASNTAYNVYNLYAYKSEGYGDVSVFASHSCSGTAFIISYPNEQVSQLPSGWIKAKTGGKVKESDTAMTLYGGGVEHDLRNEPTTPNDYNGRLKSSGIKTKGAVGITDGSDLTQVIGYRAWPDSTGGKAHELGFTGNGNLYHRTGSTTSWEDWREIAHTNALNKPVRLTNQNLNDIKTYGFYYASGDNGCTNRPSGVIAFSLTVVNTGDNWRYQNLVAATDGTIYTRMWDTQAWSEWRKTAYEDDIPRGINSVPVTIPASGWASGDGIYPKYYDIAVAGVTADDRADIVISAAGLGIAKACGMCPASETFAGKVRVRAVKAPSAAMAADCFINFKVKE